MALEQDVFACLEGGSAWAADWFCRYEALVVFAHEGVASPALQSGAVNLSAGSIAEVGLWVEVGFEAVCGRVQVSPARVRSFVFR